MTHNEAVEQMTVERYLLGELNSDAREDFEEHMFSCPDCALDARVATVFIEEAKAELGALAPTQPEIKDIGKSKKRRGHWFEWFRPAFAIPVFAALMFVIGYQNLFTFPSLRKQASEPVVIPVAALSGATRGETHPTVAADRAHGVAVPVDIPLDPALGSFSSYSFGVYGPQGQLAWSDTVSAPAQSSTGDLQLSIVIPGKMLKDGTYSISIAGLGLHGEKTPLEHYVFKVALTD